MTLFFITNISWTVWVKSEIFDKKGQEIYVVQLELDKAFFSEKHFRNPRTLNILV